MSRLVPLILPMYYTHPEVEAAYHAPGQYWFGSELVAAPFTQPRDAHTRLASQTVWLPEGDWFDFFSGEHLPGGRWQTFYGTLAETPVVARAGAIVPLSPLPEEGAAGSAWADYANPSALEVHLFPGASNAFELYEDDGESESYRQGHACRTVLSQRWSGDALEFSIAPAEGETGLAPARRTYHLALHGICRPDQVALRVNGAELPVSWEYGELTEQLSLDGVEIGPGDRLELRIAVNAGSLLGRRDRRPEKVRKLLWNFLVDDINICQELDNRMDELLGGTLPLEAFANYLNGAHLDALRRTIG